MAHWTLGVMIGVLLKLGVASRVHAVFSHSEGFHSSKLHSSLLGGRGGPELWLRGPQSGQLGGKFSGDGRKRTQPRVRVRHGSPDLPVLRQATGARVEGSGQVLHHTLSLGSGGRQNWGCPGGHTGFSHSE